MIGVFFLNPDWYFEMGTLIGMIATPIISTILSSILFFISTSFRPYSAAMAGKAIMYSVLTSELLFFFSLAALGPYLRQIEQGRIAYENAAVVQYYHNDRAYPEVASAIQSRLPQKWRLEEIRYDKKLNIFWFTVLEPSSTKGSIPYIGIYQKETDKILDLVNMKEIWERFVSKEGWNPKDTYQSAVFNFNYIKIHFRTMTEKSVYVSLTVENDKIKDQGRDR